MKVIIALKKSWSLNKARGVGTYTRELTNALQKLYRDDQFVPTSHDYSSLGGTIVHYPFFDPFFRTLPLYRPLPTVVTIHDLIPLKYPRHFKKGIRGTLKWWIQRYIARHAAHIITDSEASKRDIVSIVHVNPDKVTAIPLAPAGDNSGPSTTKLDLPLRYILYVGDINWNKNVVGLVKAFGELKNTDHDLVLVGKAFVTGTATPEWKQIIKAIDRSPRKDRIKILGYVDADDLATVYSKATAYIQPSWDEGFGLPVLEAMQHGCPVVSSNRGSLPEVGGDAVIYADPDKLAPVIDALLADTNLQKKCRTAGSKRVKEFTWEKTARATHEVYEKVLG